MLHAKIIDIRTLIKNLQAKAKYYILSWYVQIIFKYISFFIFLPISLFSTLKNYRMKLWNLKIKMIYLFIYITIKEKLILN